MVAAVATDVELVARWREGDEHAARELFDRYFDPLYRFFASKVSRGIEDLVQETLLACVQAKDTLIEGAAFRTYLFGVARRRLYRKWRNERHGANAIDFGLLSVVDVSPSPSRIAAQQHRQAQLLEAMRRIPVELQIALELFYWEEMPASEVAKVLEIPEGTVRSRLRRARALVEAELAKAGHEPADERDYADLSQSLRRKIARTASPEE